MLSGAMVTFATNGFVFMAGRAFLGIAIGGFWSMSTATVMRLVPKESVGKGLALINGGNALAATVAAPLGSFLGQYIGWRGSFFVVIPLGVAAFVWQWMSLPALQAERTSRSKNPFGLLKDPAVSTGMAAILLLFMGQFALFTYLRPFLENVTGVNVSVLSLMLLGLGASGLVGTYFIGTLLQKRMFAYLIAIPLSMALIAILLVMFGQSSAMVGTLLLFWGLVATPAPVAWGLWLSRTIPEDAETGGGLMVAVIQFAITLGAAIGGVMFDALGWWSPFAFAATSLVGSGLLALAGMRASQVRPAHA
jgi:DHA1 family purine ribonucleoside efflux pump-like MFS transporter